MSYYSLFIKKGDITLEVNSISDADFIARQVKKIVEEFTNVTFREDSTVSIKIEETLSEPEVISETKVSETVFSEEPIEEIEEITLKVEEPQVEELISNPEPEPKPAEPVVTEEPVSEVPEASPEPAIIEETAVEPVKEEKKTDEKSDLDDFSQILEEKVATLPIEEAFAQIDKEFDAKAEKKAEIEPEVKIEKKPEKENVKKPELKAKKSPPSGSLEELIMRNNPESLLDYLLITAYYLKEHENADRYSLKQINAKVMNFSKSPIDHAVVQKAVSQEYLEVVPDFTGMAGVTEYRISPKGEKFVLNGE